MIHTRYVDPIVTQRIEIPEPKTMQANLIWTVTKFSQFWMATCHPKLLSIPKLTTLYVSRVTLPELQNLEDQIFTRPQTILHASLKQIWLNWSLMNLHLDFTSTLRFSLMPSLLWTPIHLIYSPHWKCFCVTLDYYWTIFSCWIYTLPESWPDYLVILECHSTYAVVHY